MLGLRYNRRRKFGQESTQCYLAALDQSYHGRTGGSSVGDWGTSSKKPARWDCKGRRPNHQSSNVALNNQLNSIPAHSDANFALRWSYLLLNGVQLDMGPQKKWRWYPNMEIAAWHPVVPDFRPDEHCQYVQLSRFTILDGKGTQRSLAYLRKLLVLNHCSCWTQHLSSNDGLSMDLHHLRHYPDDFRDADDCFRMCGWLTFSRAFHKVNAF